MSPPREEESLVGTERLVLRAMCQGTPQGSVREAAIQMLRDYNWREPVHQVVFNCVLEIPTENRETVRNLLPERLTRKGFPDVEWEVFFEPHSLTQQDAEQLMRELKASSR